MLNKERAMGFIMKAECAGKWINLNIYQPIITHLNAQTTKKREIFIALLSYLRREALKNHRKNDTIETII